MLDLPVRARVHHGGPINVDVVFVVESEGVGSETDKRKCAYIKDKNDIAIRYSRR